MGSEIFQEILNEKFENFIKTGQHTCAISSAKPKQD